MKLYEISDAIELILAREVDHETGEMTDATCEALTALEMALADKTLAVAAYMKGELAEADAVDREIENLKKRSRGHRSRAAWLRDYIEMNWPVGSAPLEDGRSRIAWRKNPPKVALCENVPVPPEFARTIPARTEPDLNAIKAALKDGRELECATLVQTSRLEIK